MVWFTSIIGVFSDLLTKIVLALMILLIGFVLGKIVGRLTYVILHEAELNRVLKKIGTKVSIERSLSKILEYFVNALAIIMAVNQFGITGIVAYVFAVLLLAFIVISLFLSFRSIIPNVIAGFFLMKKDKIKIGDTVKVNNLEGKVTTIDFFETLIKTKSGEIIHVPNVLLEKQVILVRRKN